MDLSEMIRMTRVDTRDDILSLTTNLKGLRTTIEMGISWSHLSISNPGIDIQLKADWISELDEQFSITIKYPKDYINIIFIDDELQYVQLSGRRGHVVFSMNINMFTREIRVKHRTGVASNTLDYINNMFGSHYVIEDLTLDPEIDDIYIINTGAGGAGGALFDRFFNDMKKYMFSRQECIGIPYETIREYIGSYQVYNHMHNQHIIDFCNFLDAFIVNRPELTPYLFAIFKCHIEPPPHGTQFIDIPVEII